MGATTKVVTYQGFRKRLSSILSGIQATCRANGPSQKLLILLNRRVIKCKLWGDSGQESANQLLNQGTECHGDTLSINMFRYTLESYS